MNLQRSKARIPIAALGVTALVCGAGALVATPASAVGQTLTILGADSNAAAIVAVDPIATAPGASYGIKVGSIPSGDTRDLDVEVLTGPTGGAVYSERINGNGAPAANTDTPTTLTPTGSNTAGSTTLTLSAANGSTLANHVLKIGTNVVAVTAGGTTATLTVDHPIPTAHAALTPVVDLGLKTATDFLPTAAGNATTIYGYDSGNDDNVYFGATVAGTYTLRLFKDVVGDGSYQSNADDTTPTFTLTVKNPVDAFSLSAPATVEAGTNGPIATVGSSVSTSDIRGGSPATLATALAAQMSLAITDNGTTGVTGEGTGTTVTYDATRGFYRYLSSSATTALTRGGGTPHTITTALTFAGGSTLTSKTTEVTTNGVNALTPAVADGQDDDVLQSGGAVTVRTGVADVVYVALAEDTTPTGLAAKTVTFTIAAGSGIALTDLKANGVAVPTDGKVTATTDADGYASVKITSAKTANGNAYTVTPTSGVATVTPSALTVTYAAARATTINVTSSSAELTPSVSAANVTVKGDVLDQFGVKFQPPSSDSQQVAVTGAATGNAVVTAGSFSYTYTPATTPTAGTTAALTFTYDNVSGSDPTATATIQWASTTAAASITLTTPANGAKAATLQDNTAPLNATQVNGGTPPFGNTTGAVTGTVYDSSSTALAFKTVTLSGSDGVYFSTSATPDATHKLMKTLDVVTSNAGVITGAYVFFTKSGSATVTAKSGVATATSTVTVSDPGSTSGYHIIVNDVNASPGQTVIVTGQVNDIFDNPVPNANVDLSTGTSTVGALGDSTIQTNSKGIFSTTFVSGSNKSGTVEVTATIDVLAADPTAIAAFGTAGITIAKGNYQDVGKLFIEKLDLTLSATATLAGGGTAKVSGSFMPDTSIDIYARASGDTKYDLVDSVTTDDEGDYGASFPIKKTTYFLAKANGMSSKVDATQVMSVVTLTGMSHNHNEVTLSANGAPNAKGTLTFYRSVAGEDPVLAKVNSDDGGNKTVTVSLPKGSRKVYVVYKAPGTGAGTSTSITVKVK